MNQRNFMILHSESDNRGGGRVSTTFEQDFQPLPEYTQSTTSNATYANVTTTRTDPDGTVTQSFQIITKK
jgi:hypothetical protein